MEIQYQNNTTGVFHFDWVIYFYFLSPLSDVAMQKYLLSLILVFQIKHSLAVCTYKVSNLKLVKIVFSSEFVIFQGNRSIEQFNGAPGDKCANWQARFFYQAGNVTSTTWCVASKSGSSCITATITLSLINDQSGWDNFPALCLPL